MRPSPGFLVLALASLNHGCAVPSDPVPSGDTLYVAPAADGEWDDAEHARGVYTFTTIQAAIDAASSGDTVSVPAGTYTETLTMKAGVAVVGAGQTETKVVGTVTFTGLTGASLRSLSLYDPTYVSTRVPYGNYAITVSGGAAEIEDVAAYYYNSGVYSAGATSIEMNDLRLGGNWYGTIMYAVSSYTLTNSFVYSNRAGGHASYGGSVGKVQHNTFIGNGFGGTTSYLTGAVSMGTGGSDTVANNIIVSNYYGVNCYSCTMAAEYNLVWGNTTNYVNDASAAATDLSSDPQFKDASEGDYGLASISPCIDAGGASYGIATDADGESRPQGDGYDIGMDEYTVSSYDLLITEVMSNPRTESSGEFVEVYNLGTGTVDLAGLKLTDGDATDTLAAYKGGVTTLAPGAYAVIVDPDYAGTPYSIPSDVTVLTTGDTNLGNGLTTADPITVYESDGTTVIATFSFPSDPGDGYSLEMLKAEDGDVSGNWRASACDAHSSPGQDSCFPETGDPASLVITEVMYNPVDESTGEYVEIYNPTDTEIDLTGLVVADSASKDKLVAWAGGSTLLGPYQHALILDGGYAYQYYLPTDIVLMSAGSTIGNGLSATDRVYLYDTDGSTLIDSYTTPVTTSDGASVEKIDYAGGDVAANWGRASRACTRGASPGRLNGQAGGLCEVLLVTEVMANADDEDRDEMIELYNASDVSVDLAGLRLSDGTELDTLQSFGGGSTVLPSGGYALVVDAEYDGTYALDSSVIVVTTGDTTLGTGLSTADPVYLYEADGLSTIDAFLYPSNPGNAVSVERVALSGKLDSADNWTASTCAAKSSPGVANCASGSTSSGGTSVYDIVITEVVSNANVESTGEFVELYNNGTTSVNLLSWVLYDGDAADTLFGFSSLYDTVLEPGEYAVVLDANYAGDYSTLPSGALLLTTDDSNIGSGLSTDDPIYLYESDGLTAVDQFTHPWDPGNAVSIERIDISAADSATNWRKSLCSSGSSPGQGTCP